jgi:uncharacterized protein YcfJ
MKRTILAALAVATLAGVSVQAQTVQQKKEEAGAVGGAVSGGAAGAVGGAIVGGPVGAAVGGVVGATAGAITGSTTARLSPEDRVYFRERVVTRQVPSAAYQGEIVVGSELPGSVRYYEIEGRPSLDNYRYARINNRYVVVDRSNRVIEVIE